MHPLYQIQKNAKPKRGPHGIVWQARDEVLDVDESAGDEVVDGDDRVSLGEKPFAQVGADETCAAGDHRSHDGESWSSGQFELIE